MSVTYEDAVKASKELGANTFFSDPNVVHVGHAEEKNESGEPTGGYCIEVGVISIEAYRNMRARGETLFPERHILRSSKPGEEDKCVPIKVIETGEIKLLVEEVTNTTQCCSFM